MLAAGLLYALRGVRQRAVGNIRAQAAATAALQQLHASGRGPRAVIIANSRSGGSHSWLSGASTASFSSSAVVSGSKQAGGANESSSGSPAAKPPRRKGREREPQLQLQAWLQREQGLTATAADQHARRLAHVFKSQQAALDGLPATFEWCRRCGLTGQQTAQLLHRVAAARRENVVQFASLVQPVWQLLDSHIAAHVEPLRQAGARLPKHTSLAEVLCSSAAAATALVMPPGHVEAWLAAVGERLPAAAIGRLLLSSPLVVKGSPTTAMAAISWAADVLGVTDPAAFFAGAHTLLSREVPTLQRNLDSLQQGLGWTAEQARRLVLKQPVVLASSPDTVQAALAWVRQLFPDAAQLEAVISRGPQLLRCSVQHLQGNADTLQQALGWRDGSGQLAAFVAAYPQPFATVNLSNKRTADKLRLLTGVVGVSTERCLTEGSGYLKTRLETMAAHYMLVQERAPHLLCSTAGKLQLSWICSASKPSCLSAMGITQKERNAFVREWPRSEEGRRLLEGLRAGSVEGWPRPPPLNKAEQRTGRAAATSGKRQGGQQVSEKGAAHEADSKSVRKVQQTKR